MELVNTGASLATNTLLGVLGLCGFKRNHIINQTVAVGEKQSDGGRARRNYTSPNHLVSHLEEDEVYTLYDSLMKSCKKFGKKNIFAERKKDSNGNLGEFKWITYDTFLEKVETLYQGLCKIGVRPKDKIGIFSRNRIEWLTLQAASFLQSNIIVSFYETLGVESLSFVCDHAEIHMAFCSRETLEKTIEISKNIKVLKTIVCFDRIDEEKDSALLESMKAQGLKFYNYCDIVKKGEIAQEENEIVSHVPPNADSLTTIMYTSGTTGDPKGVMITHRNLTSVVSAVNNFVKVLDNDVHYSYLPYAHILERVVVLAAFHYGAAIGIFSGDTNNILTEVKTLRPTLFIGVPRIFERIRAGVQREIGKKSIIVQSLFKAAYGLKSASIEKGVRLPIIESLLDKIVFDKIKLQLGGQVRCILSGGAPLSRETEIFLRCCFCCPVVQGFGLTESCGGTCVKLLEDEAVGSIGPPFVSVEIKLVDVPELNYFSKGDSESGEVCLRGPSVTSGYYKDPVKTSADFKDGWFYTGDIGRWNKDGTLSIIDRKKNIFKLSQGEYVAVEKIENIISKSKYVNQICVYGDSQKSCLIAIIHPHDEIIDEYSNSKKSDKSRKQVCKDPQFISVVLEDITKIGKGAKLFGFEIPKAVYLVDEPFSDQNGLLTPSFKLKRPQIKDYYSNEIHELYSKIGNA